MLRLARGMIYRGVLSSSSCGCFLPKAFQDWRSAQALLIPVASRNLEKVLAHFVAVPIESGFKKDNASELNIRHDLNIDCGNEQESLNFFSFGVIYVTSRHALSPNRRYSFIFFFNSNNLNLQF